MTSLNVPNAITNGTTADATDVQQNFDAIETHVNTEVVNRDGSIAMTGELLLPSNPISNLAAATKSYVDGEVTTLEGADTALQSNIDSEATARANADTALDGRVTTLEGKDFTVTFGAGSDLDGSFTVTNLGNVTNTTVAVRNDSHTHDGRYYTEAEADARFLGITAKAADSELLDSLDSSQFLRSDANDTATGNLVLSGTVTVGGTGQYLRFKDTTDNSHYGEFRATLSASRTYTFPNASGTVALTSSDITGNAATATYATSAGTAGSASFATNAGYATSAGNADTVDSYQASAFLLKTGGTVTGDTAFSAASSSGSDTVALQVTGSNASIALRSNGAASNSSQCVQMRSGQNAGDFRAMLYVTQHDGNSMADITCHRLYYNGGSVGSSRTIKENIVPAFTADNYDAVELVKQLDTSTFNYIDGSPDDVQLGLIAEDVFEVAPDFVELRDGSPRYLKQSIHFLTLAALRQAVTKIETLEAQVAALQG